MKIEEISLQNVSRLVTISAEADREECHYVRQTMDEWVSHQYRFDHSGECLLGMFESGTCIGLAGICIDPHLNDLMVGRLRRVYVSPASRRQGVAESLIRVLLNDASNHFNRVRLNTRSENAARLYMRIGFNPVKEEMATHAVEVRKGTPDNSC